ncbi:unnamed protein product [Polarella glacialis]|uniref:Uncharacterized protein n=1 Tax=Polarella glacialis TaxID=89957 RepID=A0A813DBH5_POLGL|nr:unnamed protein product [Polarella glacialis]
MERRSEAGRPLPLVLHEGLAAAARSLAQTQRLRVRETQSDRATRILPSEIQAMLASLPLPPGFDAAHLHFTSTELPSLFGLSSSTGSSSGTPMGGKNTGEDKDASADIIAREAVGLWAARQAQDVTWPCAAICGVGAALDYTVNRGFVVALLVGFEGVAPEADQAVVKRRDEKAVFRRRMAAATAAADAASSAGAAEPSYGARIRTLGNPSQDAVINRK